MAFPTLTESPSSIETEPEYSTIKTEFEGGYQQARERHTRNRKTFKAQWVSMSRANLDLLLAHYDTVRGSGSFLWTNDDDDAAYTVRYESAPKRTADGKFKNSYAVSIALKEV